MLGCGIIMGPIMLVVQEYGLAIENSANLVTTPTMHATDALCFVLGEFNEPQATLASHGPQTPMVPRDLEDF